MKYIITLYEKGNAHKILTDHKIDKSKLVHEYDLINGFVADLDSTEHGKIKSDHRVKIVEEDVEFKIEPIIESVFDKKKAKEIWF